MNEKRIKDYLNLWATSEYGVPYLVAKDRSRGASAEFERFCSILCDYERVIKKLEDREKVLSKVVLEFYMCNQYEEHEISGYALDRVCRKHKDLINELEHNLEVKSEH